MSDAAPLDPDAAMMSECVAAWWLWADEDEPTTQTATDHFRDGAWRWLEARARVSVPPKDEASASREE